MRIRDVILSSALLLLAAPLFAGVQDDVIVMKNGDRLTCQVKGLDSGVLYVSLDYVLQTISVEWSKVAKLESSHIFIVETADGSVYSGTISSTETPGERPIKIQVAESPEKKVVLDGPQIVVMEETSNKFWQRFNGSINSGIIYTKGNQSAQYSLSSDVGYPREHWAATASFNSTLSSNSGNDVSARNQVGFQAMHLLPWANYFYAGQAGFLQSSEQGIHVQTNLGGGIGRYLKNTNHARISLLGGLAWQRTDYVQSVVPLSPQNIAAAIISASVKTFQFNKTNLSLTASVLPALSEPGRVFGAVNATYYVKLFSNLSWNVSFYGNWDNRPPATFSSSDYGTSSGLSWTFGNR